MSKNIWHFDIEHSFGTLNHETLPQEFEKLYHFMCLRDNYF